MPEVPADNILTTLGRVEDLETFKLRRQAARIVPQLLDPLSRSHVIQHLDDPDTVDVRARTDR